MDWIKEKYAAAKARLYAFLGNSRTLAIAFALELLSLADEINAIPWSNWFGADRAGRISGGVTTLFIFLRLITKGGVSFKPKE